MRIKVIVFFERHENDVVEEAFRPYHQLPEEEHGVLTKLANIIESRAYTEDHLTMVHDALTRLQRVLEIQSRAFPAPEWVAQADAALKAGQAPFIPNPQSAVAVLREVRTGQVKKITEALLVLGRALNLAEQAHNGEDPCEDGEDPSNDLLA